MSGKIYASNLSVDFFAEKDFEPLENLSSEEADRANARNLVRLLMLEQVIGWRQAVNLKTCRFAFYDASQRDRAFMLEALQEGLTNIGRQLQETTLDAVQERQAEILINSILSYLPFAYPSKDTPFEVPEMINGQWQMVAYKINPIELTAPRRNIPLFFNDSDRVWAYGLEPLFQEKEGSPWLVFHGTTYPSGTGFTTQVMSDMKPFQTVGHDLFVSGEEELEKWFNRFPNKKMNVTGVSLGGSLSLLTACRFGNLCGIITALNPAGLVENSTLKQIDRWDDFREKADVRVVKQGADPVSIFGTWKPDWTILLAEVSELSPNFFTHHFVNFAGSKHTRFIEEPTDNDKNIRKFNNLLWYTGGRAVAYTLFLLPWRYVLLPMYRLAKAILFATFALVSALLSAVISFVNNLMVSIAQCISDMAQGLNCCVVNTEHSMQTASENIVADVENNIDSNEEMKP